MKRTEATGKIGTKKSAKGGRDRGGVHLREWARWERQYLMNIACQSLEPGDRGDFKGGGDLVVGLTD